MTNFLDSYLFVFVFGFIGMLNAMKKICTKLGVKKEMIKAEIFLGY